MKAKTVKVAHECGNIGTLGAYTSDFQSDDKSAIDTIAEIVSAERIHTHCWLSDKTRAALSVFVGFDVRKGSYVWFAD